MATGPNAERKMVCAKRWDLTVNGYRDFEKMFKRWWAKQNHDFDFEKRFKNWVAVTKRRLPSVREAAAATYVGIGIPAALSLYYERFMPTICSICSIPRPSPQSQFLLHCGGFKPLVGSFLLGDFLERTNYFLIMMASNATISFMASTIRDKDDDVYTSMVSGFGYGVVISLVTGMKGPSVISSGAMFALLNAGMHKVGLDPSKIYKEM
ncbi:hypothetical protein R6Q59_027862 [Mikania micrantha]